MSTPAIRIALATDGQHFLMVRGRRGVSIEVRFVAEMLGLPPANIPVGKVREIAETVFENPARYEGRILYCPEMFDLDRRCAMDLYRVDEQGNVLPCPPLCGECGKEKTQCDAPGGFYWSCTPCEAKSNIQPMPPPATCTCTGTRTDPTCPLHGYGAQSEDFRDEVGG